MNPPWTKTERHRVIISEEAANSCRAVALHLRLPLSKAMDLLLRRKDGEQPEDVLARDALAIAAWERGGKR